MRQRQASCTFALTASSALEATFLLENTLAVRKTGTGGGTVTSEPAGLDCGLTCEAVFSHGQSVTLDAVPVEGKVGGWSGCESVTGPGNEKCAVQITTAQAVSVEFVSEPATKFKLTAQVTGGGEVLAVRGRSHAWKAGRPGPVLKKSRNQAL